MADFHFEVIGQTGVSRTATITVMDVPAPVPYDAGGFMACEVSAESILSLARRARTRRMTHEDLVARWPTDEGRLHADRQEGRVWTFFTKEKLRAG